MACPFLAKQGGSNENNKDPDEFLYEEGYEIPQTSPFQNLIDHCKPAEMADRRQKFEKYSLYLKNTLFQPDHLKKLRKLEFMEKLVALDDFKKAGNKHYHAKEYEKALECYEFAYGIYKYLEFKTEEDSKLKVITDDAIILVSPQPREPNEVKITKAAMVTILLNISSAMIPLKHYDEAIDALSEAIDYDPDNTHLYSKRCQTRLYNLGSSEDDLNLALLDAKRVAEAQSLNELVDKCEGRLREFISEETAIINEITISLSKHGVGESDEITEEIEFEQKVVNKMIEKYTEMLKFYQETNKYHQRIRIRKEMSDVQPIYYKMNRILHLNTQNLRFYQALKNAGLDPTDKKVQSSVESIKRFKISMSFTGGKFNDQLLNFCIDKCSEEERLKRKSQAKLQSKNGWGYTMPIIGVLIVIIAAWFLKRMLKF